MKLTKTQLDAFERDGYLFFPGLFRPAENKVLLDEVPALYAQRRPENVREKTGDVPLPWKDGTPADELQGVLKAA